MFDNAVASDFDPFSREFLENPDPFPIYEELRELGPLIWLRKYEIWCATRHEQCHAILSDWKTFSSARGAGIHDFAKEKPWRPPSPILEADPPQHSRTRGVLTRILSPAAIAKLREKAQRDADELLNPLLERRTFDAIADFTEKYPLKVFPDAVGVPNEGREHLLAYGNLLFNSFGMRNWLFEESLKETAPTREWIARMCSRESLHPDGFGAQIYAAADAGELPEEEATLLVRSFLGAGIDTTVHSLGLAIYLLARDPAQWQLLRDKPNLARSAFDEVLRYAGPMQVLFRTTTREVEIGGVKIDEGRKVAALLGCANRDPRRWENPDTFDITRKATGHLAFGTGIHGCVGQAVARMEAEVLLTTLAKKVQLIEVVGEPKRRLNNTLRAISTLPVRIHPA